MCFSATASFTAAIVIGSIGVATLKTCNTSNERYFGAIPLLFAFQQFIEGFVWLSLTRPEYSQLQGLASVSFLFFAWVVWPILIPLSVYKLENGGIKKSLNRWLFFLGLGSGLYALYTLAAGQVIPYVAELHIDYKFVFEHKNKQFLFIQQAVYLMVTILPLFLSTVKGTKILATANLISLMFAFLFFSQALPSVWCFFAAILSGIIYWILKTKNHPVPESMVYVQK